MKIKELISELKKLNQEAEVGFPDMFGAIEGELDIRESMWNNKDGSPNDILLE